MGIPLPTKYYSVRKILVKICFMSYLVEIHVLALLVYPVELVSRDRFPAIPNYTRV
jgi:hypothetical protein